jgi:hypothetical protein
LRQYFHTQLKELVQGKAFEPFKRLVESEHKRATILSVGNFAFVPLIAESLQQFALYSTRGSD